MSSAAGTTSVEVRLELNGIQRTLTVATHAVLADVLRDDCGLQGCHIACDAGVCGACTVLIDGQPSAACSALAFEADGAVLTTIEGLGDAALHPLQRAFLEREAFQCGYCTGGMILAAHALLRENPDPDEAAIRAALAGNLCRCTGYQMIIEAVQAAAAAMRLDGAEGTAR
ncbi:MAG: (2Fe-2S)-binding protein [Chitinophagaceae bacterium]|nr:(2Fe-2S)-binding protein [Rubrivivax sp.]